MKRTCWLIVVLILASAGCIGTDLVDELPTADARIDVTPAEAALEQGNTLRLEAIYYDGFGMPVPGVTLRWESSAPGVASVDADGLVSALAIGQALITAHADDASSLPVLLTVVGDPNSVARVVVTPDTLLLPAGSSQAFTAEAFNLNGDRLDGKTFTWASSNQLVATIDAGGDATALEPGVADITATTDGIDSAPATLIVPGGVRQGAFVKRAGSSYLVQGTATLEELPGGGLRLMFSSDFLVSSGPGLEVFLSNTTTVGSGSFNVGELQKDNGEQTYFIGSGASLTLNSYNNVVIHCVPFNVTFGHAALQ